MLFAVRPGNFAFALFVVQEHRTQDVRFTARIMILQPKVKFLDKKSLNFLSLITPATFLCSILGSYLRTEESLWKVYIGAIVNLAAYSFSLLGSAASCAALLLVPHQQQQQQQQQHQQQDH